MDIKTYKKEADYSYTLGAFPTFELIDAMPEQVEEILERFFDNIERDGYH